MTNLLEVIHTLFPLVALVFLIAGIRLKRKNYLIASLWLSLIALVLHYRASGGEILGSYFNYMHATIYSINLLIMVISIGYLLLSGLKSINNKFIRYAFTFLTALLFTGSLMLLINLWINAFFVENRYPGTPVLQVATFNKPSYCSFRYVFYKTDTEGVVHYLCPNHYGFIPGTGVLEQPPGFVLDHLPAKLQSKYREP